jgi:lysophospholipase L1-like esterase
MRVFSLAALVGLVVASVACEGPDTDASPADATEQDASAVVAEAGTILGAGLSNDAGSSAPSPDANVAPAIPALDAAPAQDAAPTDAGDASSAVDADARAPVAEGGSLSSASPCPETGACVILPLGDSITFGLGVSDNASYRVELFRKATAAQHEITFSGSLQSGPTNVDGKPFPRKNEGHSGWTISQIAGTVPSPALQTKPHIVLLMAGTNDMYMSPMNAPMRLGALLDKLVQTDPNLYVVVAQLTPLNSSASAIKTFNDAVPALVRERAMAGKHVFLVDLNTGFPANALSDGVHPNAEGYKWMADVWYKAIEGWLR